ncbi:MAG TPA: glycerol kinase GlpK, partial [Chloroflexota bacterium]|nr:glycerol kinase GlpK [Chloroflexota bacterium]
CVYPRPGWVEQDAADLWLRSLAAVSDSLESAPPHLLVAIGLTNQRETTVLWDAATMKPVAPAIVWQCRRTTSLCDDLRRRGLAREVMSRTGLVIDPYFSGTKIQWLLQSDPSIAERASRGELKFGTIDSWLLANLTGGAVHRTDYSNASRTLLYNIYDKCWDSFLLDELAIPESLLPEVASSRSIHGSTVAIELPNGNRLPAGLPIGGIAGDQQAALFGQACFTPGMAKCTYGTGAFLLLNNGTNPVRSSHGLLTTLACGADGEAIYALEGSIFVAGAAVQWLRDQLGIIQSAAETELLAAQTTDNAGVYLVPAFVGLGAPYWDPGARGAILGLTRGVGRAHLARAALEAVAYQTRDVVDAMTADGGLPLRELRIDGGAAANNFLAQFQSDILNIPVLRPMNLETTAMGSAYLAGLATGFWDSVDEVGQLWEADRAFTPRMDQPTRAELYRGWSRAVSRVRSEGEATPTPV